MLHYVDAPVNVSHRINRNTDYVLVPLDLLSDAIKALSNDGWMFDEHNL